MSEFENESASHTADMQAAVVEEEITSNPSALKREKFSNSQVIADNFRNNRLISKGFTTWRNRIWNRSGETLSSSEPVVAERDVSESIIQQRVFFTWRELFTAHKHYQTYTLRRSFSKFQAKIVYRAILNRYVAYVLKRRALRQMRFAINMWTITTVISKENSVSELVARRFYLQRRLRTGISKLKAYIQTKYLRRYTDLCEAEMTRFRARRALQRWFSNRNSIRYYEPTSTRFEPARFRLVERLRRFCVLALHIWRRATVNNRRLRMAEFELKETINQRRRCDAMKKWKKAFRHRIRDLRRYRVAAIQSFLVLRKFMRKWRTVFEASTESFESRFLLARALRTWYQRTASLTQNRLSGTAGTEINRQERQSQPARWYPRSKRVLTNQIVLSASRSTPNVPMVPPSVDSSVDQLMELSQAFKRFVSLMEECLHRRVLHSVALNVHLSGQSRRRAHEAFRRLQMHAMFARQYRLVTRAKTDVNLSACWRVWIAFVKKRKSKRSLIEVASLLYEKVTFANHVHSGFRRWLQRTEDNKKNAQNSNEIVRYVQRVKLRSVVAVWRARSKMAILEEAATVHVHRLSSCRRALKDWRSWHGSQMLQTVVLLLGDQQYKRFWVRSAFGTLSGRHRRTFRGVSDSTASRRVSFSSEISNHNEPPMSPVSHNLASAKHSFSVSFGRETETSEVGNVDAKFNEQSCESVKSGATNFSFQSSISGDSFSNRSQYSSLHSADSISLLQMRHNRISSSRTRMSQAYSDRICNEAAFFYEARLRAKKGWFVRLLRRKATASRLLRQVYQVAMEHHE